MALEKQL